MIEITAEQRAALAEADAFTARQVSIREKIKFIGHFLSFADQVTKPSDAILIGRPLKPSGTTYSQSESTSRAVRINIDPHITDVGATITAYRTGFGRPRFAKYVNLGTHVHAADVNIGAIHDVAGLGMSPRLLGAVPVLRVVEYPPSIYYGPNQTELTNVEQGTEAWGEMTVLVKELESGKRLLN